LSTLSKSYKERVCENFLMFIIDLK